MALKYLYVPSGVQAGKAYSVIPEIINSEELTNGDFEQGSTGWTLAGVQNSNNYATFSNGRLVLRNDGSSSGVSQTILTSGNTYDVELYVSDIVGNGFKVNVGAGINYEITTTGRIRFTIKATSSIFYLYRSEENPQAVNGGTIESVSVRETGADFSSFSRSSAGSRVDKNGFINTGLGLGSEEIVNGSFDADSNWTKGTGWAIANGVATYDGTGGSSFILQNLSIPINTLYEVKITVLSNEGTGINIIEIGNHRINNDHLDAGTYTFYFTSTSGTNFFLIYGRSGEELVIDNVSVREITEVNTNVPRLDYTDGGCPSLLLEPTSTNITKYSEDFAQSSWTKEGNPTIESDVEISPTGSLNGSYLKAPVGTSISPRIVSYFGCGSGQTYTGSIFVKKDNVDYIRILSTGATASTLDAYYNVSNGILGNSGSPDKAKIEDYGNGWYRLSLVINTTQNTGSATFRIQLAKGDGAPTSTYDGTEKNIIFGAQLEQQSYATSYIPNYGTALGVTRSQDVGGGTGDLSSVVNSQEGTFMFEGGFSDQDLKVSLNSSTTTFSDRIAIRTMSGTQFRIDYFAGGSGGNAFFNVSSTKDNNKIAIKWISESLVVYHNGIEVVDVTNIGDFSSGILDRISLSAADNTSNKFKGRVKQLRVYDEYLSDEEMVKLTTL